MKKLAHSLQIFFRLLLKVERRKELVWKDLKKLFSEADWKCGIYENDRIIETRFALGENIPGIFHYLIDDEHYHCWVNVLEDYPVEYTTDIFILAAHFNNLLNKGTVVVDPVDQHVIYQLKTDLLVTLMNNEEVYLRLIRHYETSKKIYSAFQRLVNENEDPPIIIADLLKEKTNEQ